MKILFDRTELQQRISLNCRRLEEDPYYQIGDVFSDIDYDWYGDKEGRALLAFVNHYQMSKASIPCMEQMLAQLPERTNIQGYFGPLASAIIHEQQLSGHSWLLRGLCAHHEQFGDAFSLQAAQNIANNLYMPTLGRFASYPIDRSAAQAGGVSGSSQESMHGWQLSTDIGCAFMSIDGLSHVYKLTHDASLKQLIDEMIETYARIDKITLRAQTHCTLTAARGMMRMYGEIGDNRYLDHARDIWNLYVHGGGMTYTYQNLNWWNRPDSWTEPCAIVDSLMLSIQLYQAEPREEYRQTAARIWINGFASLQRDNGGAGTDTLICPESGHTELYAQMYEAFFCCTMRLAEGLQFLCEHGDLLWGETGEELLQDANGIYHDGDYIYAEISGGGQDYSETKVERDGHILSPLLKYYKLPQDVLMQTRQRIIF